MLTICDSYASDYSISFNASKSKCLVVLPNSRRSLRDYVTNCIFSVGGKPIEYVDSFSHLGHIITSNLSDTADITNRRNTFVGQVNSVLCFFNNLNSSIKYKLFQSYCMSVYGCELWSLSNDKINDLCIAWRKSLRRVWGLPYNTHCYILPLLSQCLPLFDEICSRSLSFIKSCLLHKSKLVSEVSNYAIRYGRYNSFLGHNALFCVRRYNINIVDIGSTCFTNAKRIIHSYCNELIEDTQYQTACFVRELLLLRENVLILSNNIVFSYNDLEQLINAVCTC